MAVHNPLAERDDGLRFLWWLSAPMFLVFLAFSFKTGGGELNWPVTAYLSGMVLAAAWLSRQAAAANLWLRGAVIGLAALTGVLGLTATVLIHRADSARPLFDGVSGPASA